MMGKFANTAAECGEPIAPCSGPIIKNEPWHGQSDFAALGYQVPTFRKSAADRHMKEMGFTDAGKRYDVIAAMSQRIARDDPHMALEDAMEKGVDATGCYRLLAVLLAAQEPSNER
jgi:hypothetical protein